MFESSSLIDDCIKITPSLIHSFISSANSTCYLFSSCASSPPILNDLSPVSCSPYDHDHDPCASFPSSWNSFCASCTPRRMNGSRNGDGNCAHVLEGISCGRDTCPGLINGGGCACWLRRRPCGSLFTAHSSLQLPFWHRLHFSTWRRHTPWRFWFPCFCHDAKWAQRR